MWRTSFYADLEQYYCSVVALTSIVAVASFLLHMVTPSERVQTVPNYFLFDLQNQHLALHLVNISQDIKEGTEYKITSCMRKD